MRDYTNFMEEPGYYGVSQCYHGHEYRWIYEDYVLSAAAYRLGDVPDEDTLDFHFPIGDPESSVTQIRKLKTEDEIKAFLTDRPNSDDPTLADIGAYRPSDVKGCGSSTDEFMKKFGLNWVELDQKEQVTTMFRKLKQCGYQGLDYEDPFFGQNRNMTLSELCDIFQNNYEEVSFTAYPYVTQCGTIGVLPGTKVDADYIREHWANVVLEAPDFDYCGTDIDICCFRISKTKMMKMKSRKGLSS